MLRVAGYKKIIVKVKGRWKYIRRPIYEDKGKGAGLRQSKDPSMMRVNGETLKI